jgi:hypothetical protein
LKSYKSASLGESISKPHKARRVTILSLTTSDLS